MKVPRDRFTTLTKSANLRTDIVLTSYVKGELFTLNFYDQVSRAKHNHYRKFDYYFELLIYNA